MLVFSLYGMQTKKQIALTLQLELYPPNHESVRVSLLHIQLYHYRIPGLCRVLEALGKGAMALGKTVC
jgi:hypothetical protein